MGINNNYALTMYCQIGDQTSSQDGIIFQLFWLIFSQSFNDLLLQALIEPNIDQC